eukprot:SAG22_NODE_2283_length_2758_cov_31.640090_4_plen_91_part_01
MYTLRTLGARGETSGRTRRAQGAPDADKKVMSDEPAPEQPGEFVFVGVKPRALVRLMDKYPVIRAYHTTSDVCHTILKPLTTPAGWVDRAT